MEFQGCEGTQRSAGLTLCHRRFWKPGGTTLPAHKHRLKGLSVLRMLVPLPSPGGSPQTLPAPRGLACMSPEAPSREPGRHVLPLQSEHISGPHRQHTAAPPRRPIALLGLIIVLATAPTRGLY